MKVYRASYRDPDGTHYGYAYHANRRDVKRIDNEMLESVVEYDIPLTKSAVLRFLNSHCAHPDNG